MLLRLFPKTIRWLGRRLVSLAAAVAVALHEGLRRHPSLPPSRLPRRRSAAGPAPTPVTHPVVPVAHPVGPVAVGHAAERRRQLAALTRLARGGGADRRLAMQQAGRWGDPAVLPLLRRGLRDADPAVMAAAARGMERFRGKPGSWLAVQTSPLPRRVARTR